MNTEIILGIIGIIGAIFGGQGFWAWIMNRQSGKSDEAKLLMGIAYSKIIQQCQYYIDRGWIDADEYHELHHYLFKPYQNMGGNGTAERMMKLVNGLPNKEEKHE